MKRLLKNSVIVILLFGTAISLHSCKKDETPPVVLTITATDITQTTVLTGGKVTNDGGAEIIDIGICWDTSPNPTISSNKKSYGTGIISFTGKITGLKANTLYYFRAYATNSIGTGYGKEISFTTNQFTEASTIPSLTTSDVTSITTTNAISGGNIIDDGGGDIIAKGVSWSTTPEWNIYLDDATVYGNGPGTGSFVSYLSNLKPGTIYYVKAFAVNSVGIAFGPTLSFTTSLPQSTGTQKAIFPGGPRYNAASFSIGTKVYLGLGYNDGDNSENDFWEWDQATNVWVRKADFPGNSTGGVVGFSIGTRGYVGSENVSTNGSTTEFWEYDPAANIWNQKASLPTTPARNLAVGFSIGNKGYIGLGTKDLFIVSGNPGYYQDFWEWDQATNVWTKKADFGGTARYGSVGFSIGNKGYIGTGYDGTSYLKDFWEWDQETNIWTKKADFGGTARTNAVGFSIGNKGYIGTGYNGGSSPYSYKDIWEWDQATNVWIKKADFEGDARNSAVGVSIGNKGYIGTGLSGTYLKDFWEYEPK